VLLAFSGLQCSGTTPSAMNLLKCGGVTANFEPADTPPAPRGVAGSKMSDEHELLRFISPGSRLDIKRTALEYILGLTGSHTGREWIKINKEILERIFDLLSEQDDTLSKNAHVIIVNLSADEDVVNCMTDYVPLLLCHLKNPQWKCIDKLCTIVSNLSRCKKGAELLLNCLIHERKTTLYQLIDLFDQRKSQGARTDFDHLASVFLNFSQLKEARLLFLDPSKCILPKLLPSILLPCTDVRRRGIAGLIKNLCFEVGKAALSLQINENIWACIY